MGDRGSNGRPVSNFEIAVLLWDRARIGRSMSIWEAETDMDGAFQYMLKVFFSDVGTFSFEYRHRRAYVMQIAILVTDGKSFLNQEFTIQNAEAAKLDGIEIFVVGMCNIYLITPSSTDETC